MITDIYCSTCIQHSIHAHQFVKIISKYSWTKLHQINSECETAGEQNHFKASMESDTRQLKQLLVNSK